MSTPAFDALIADRPRRVTASGAESFAAAVRAGLTKPQRELPSHYLYDTLGTALFEAITELPEYGLTRADERVVRECAPCLLDILPPSLIVTELGSGSGRKTRWLLEVLARRDHVTYYPIDISGAALHKCKQELSHLGPVSVLGLERSYLDGLREVTARRPPGQTLLVLFLGSTIGNFARKAAEHFLLEIRQTLLPGDALLIGMDLEKPLGQLLLAYDDPVGLTAAFNRNILARINRELGGTFAVRDFAHDVRYDPQHRRIEMHLRCDRAHTVSIPAALLTCRFQAGDTIWTEASHKYALEEIRALAHRSGFACQAQWVDQEWAFAESLWIAETPASLAR